MRRYFQEQVVADTTTARPRWNHVGTATLSLARNSKTSKQSRAVSTPKARTSAQQRTIGLLFPIANQHLRNPSILTQRKNAVAAKSKEISIENYQAVSLFYLSWFNDIEIFEDWYALQDTQEKYKRLIDNINRAVNSELRDNFRKAAKLAFTEGKIESFKLLINENPALELLLFQSSLDIKSAHDALIKFTEASKQLFANCSPEKRVERWAYFGCLFRRTNIYSPFIGQNIEPIQPLIPLLSDYI